jgi:hypothetical protein
MKAFFKGYTIHSNGEVFNKDGHKISPQLINSGYLIVHLFSKGKRTAHTIHRIVATLFVPNPYKKKFVNHIDGNKLNNDYSNLEWVTGSENMKHGFASGLFDNSKEKARVRMTEISREYGTRNGKSLSASKGFFSGSVEALDVSSEEITIHVSLRAAGKHVNASHSTVSRSIKNKKPLRGYLFKLILTE